MVMILGDSHKKNLEFLNVLDESAALDFCKTGRDFLVNGFNEKLCRTAASKLKCTESQVRQTLEAIMQLFVLASKRKLTHIQLHDSLTVVGLTQPVIERIVDLYKETEELIARGLSQQTLFPSTYRSLRWRCGCVVASRCLRGQETPVVTLQLELNNAGSDVPQVINLETDPLNLKHMTEELEDALHALKNYKVKKNAAPHT